MENCLFCKILKGEIASTKVYEDEWVYAFGDINPEAPEHILIVPRRHIKSLAEVTVEDLELLGRVQYAAMLISKQLGVSEAGFRLVTNSGSHGGQTVDHLHYHFLAGRLMKWPPG